MIVLVITKKLKFNSQIIFSVVSLLKFSKII